MQTTCKRVFCWADREVNSSIKIFSMMSFQNGEVESSGVKTWRLVLTGGPCGGKTTAQNRLATFFESLGWRVFRVPETATILLNGGVRHCVRPWLYIMSNWYSSLGKR